MLYEIAGPARDGFAREDGRRPVRTHQLRDPVETSTGPTGTAGRVHMGH
ncbi:hypothetical protein Dvina_21855 [Dactylosporangium vinaceum]|uniref:Uncharacterized protein n=1 Tax=Dactylosporangium vinaceum TaxID=53362 RepID=A0ABV5MRI7_9ACTN|nr:hypothetical protein [Dactylosporangium vinaceum]UAC00459.1 hypothetical protein Dvina_21855 [Dactylosporangium vinaceum]